MKTLLPTQTLFIWLFLVLVSFQSQAAETQRKNLLIVGDSLSAAYGIDSDAAWVELLKERLEQETPGTWNVANASISGETTDGGLRRLPDLLDKHDPAIVVIELGGNDGLRGFPPDVIRTNLAKMIQLSQQHGAEILLVGIEIPPNYGQRYTTAFANVFSSLAEEYNLSFVPFFLADVYDGEAMMQADGIHPTAKAQPQLLDNIWSELLALLE
ncbi:MULTISPECIES: arylesterase [unclassified Methylophaga]|jgi:acyl-CoA thioesterase-1|uniref:arylesterase n=1 Tax=unclassified Methylophaga TaxID=2629249 RepID=UPI000C4C1DCC|nr:MULTISPECIES: arylesterase [unclassified Methylophaga]MBP23768.1 arylesterase [Methylophaga sp.]HCC80696.1 arylesterase [Methylophaga sp.]|tara:strand:+ start:2576 stop:3214 length:639 start_codon:yes stop_codon:yes gene_type:complete